MKRLTWKKPSGEWGIDGVDLATLTPRLYGALCKLKDYEDIGLEPEEIRELVQAKKDGRLVTLPTEDYCWRIRGDIALDLIQANCRRAHVEAEVARGREAEHG